MLSKNEIIKELKNENYNVRNAIYEYVCNLHLYDDEEINEALIEFIKNDYDDINFAGLRFSKLNKEIIECLIEICLNEEDEFIKEGIGKVLVNHYSLIKDLNYNFEEMIIDEYDLLLYKKIKHFSKKDPDELLDLYMNNIEKFYFTDEDTIVTEIIRMAIGIALIQTEKGAENLLAYLTAAIKHEQEELEDDNYPELYNEHMPYLVYPLCRLAKNEYAWVILELYLRNMDFLGYADECNHYFSSICDDEFVEYYKERLKSIKKSEMEDYYYDIAEYLNSEAIDDFLLEELNRNKDDEIRGNIIRILAERFNKNVIPYALDFVEKGKYDDEEIRIAIYPLLILEEKDDSTSREIINYIEEYDDMEEKAMWAEMLNNIQQILLADKEHIKEYKKIRKIHQQVIDDMMRYFEEGKFKLEMIPTKEKMKDRELSVLSGCFDASTKLGSQALGNILVYKNADNMPCITEEFIKNKKYRKEEKINMLNSMLNSEAGLFEVSKTDRENGKVYLRNVLNGNEYCLTDVGLSGNLNNEMYYMYTRVITYEDVSFGTGLLMPFNKKDPFICKWIEENIEDLNQKQEITRFIELYNVCVGNSDKTKILVNEF